MGTFQSLSLYKIDHYVQEKWRNWIAGSVELTWTSGWNALWQGRNLAWLSSSGREAQAESLGKTLTWCSNLPEHEFQFQLLLVWTSWYSSSEISLSDTAWMAGLIGALSEIMYIHDSHKAELCKCGLKFGTTVGSSWVIVVLAFCSVTSGYPCEVL